MRKAIVVGGGIGGLSAAVGLHGIGWEVTVLERAPELTAAGAGISLWPNALRSLETLGIHLDRLREQASGGLHDRAGRRITRWDAEAFRRHHGRPLAAIHRADLIGALRDALPTGCVRTGTEVTGLDGLDADVIIAADGIHSGLRKQLWPQHPDPVYSGSTAFRAVTTLPRAVDLSTSWDDGAEIGVIPLHGGQVYWWAGYVAEAGIRHEDPKSYLRNRFGGWHEPIPELIDATVPETLLHHDLHLLGTPLPSYVRGRVALLGDAAHAMPPFLGQGGCQAIEDAVVLAAALSETEDVDAALKSYDEQRRPRSQAVVKASVQAGRIGPQLRNPLGVAVRNGVARLLPGALTARIGAGVSGWTPPVPRRPAPPRTR
ncbi:FAD-dependent monooxygenase [Amycolatopsis umgeniensis]|uniref:2-polyprenyl-6-methoxyphenol hydroxylase-like FAD-dependent oxidoreductase n=1 Tax=Amycolatopsis umgeniensis TaxID=336628 RepID=A0A841B908_9PSEU|nr:FAD-dependent monooxygenase [Amycolatopsis umgeniensis]MBB5855391.1 2-polyprenyl-6-methoxyphenol hydroxylase-like FAD-dependent oxidoreductase [Amycolatopsis umgeniensis]